MTALETQGRRKTELRALLETARTPVTVLDATAVRAQLESYIVDWQGLLRGHVHQAQQILRRLIVGRSHDDAAAVDGLRKGFLLLHGAELLSLCSGGTYQMWRPQRVT